MLERQTVTVLYIFSLYEDLLSNMLSKLSFSRPNQDDPLFHIQLDLLFSSYNNLIP